MDNICFTAEELEDPFLFINKRFRHIYKQAKRVVLSEKVKKSVIGKELPSYSPILIMIWYDNNQNYNYN